MLQTFTMIVDADCHLSSQHWDGLSITADELISQMDRAGIDRALVWLKPPYNKDIGPENQAVFEATQRYPSRLIGFGWVNPRLGSQQTRDTLKRCFEEYGFYGVKFNGAQDDYVIDDASVLSWIEQAASYGKVIGFHIGADFYENTHPYRLGHIATLYPQTRFLMIHMGGAGKPSLERAALEVARQHPNILLIGSAIGERAILHAIQELGATRLSYGSDTPFGLMHVQLAMYQALLRDTPAPDRELILGANLCHWLNL